MDSPTRLKLTGITEQYKQLFPDDYEAVVRYVKALKKGLINEHADLRKFGTNVIDRALVEWPEILLNMIELKLTKGEREELFEDKNHKLIRWYAREYPEFMVSKSV